jgi:cytochrome c peroxidase
MFTRSIRLGRACCAGAAGLLALLPAAHAQSSAPPPANSLGTTDVTPPANAPAWLLPAYRHALSSPLPAFIYPQQTPPFIPQLAVFPDRLGSVGNYQPGGAVTTAPNAFFQSLGTNGRTCFTCHQTPNAMGMSAAHAQAVFAATGGQDPLFAPVDGANCPNQVPAAATSGALVGGLTGSRSQSHLRAAYSQLLNKGLFRIFLPAPANAEFSIQVVSDPNGCNTDPAYNQEVDPTTGAVTTIISVYRRPLMTASLQFKTLTLADFPSSKVPPIDFATGEPLPIDPYTGLYESLNIMWDGREPTLESQASDATLIHAQATTPPTSDQVAQMVAFENGIYSAQGWLGPVALWQGGADGGAVYLSSQSPLESTAPFTPNLVYYSGWSNITATTPTTELQASIARGQALFDNFQFTFMIGPTTTLGCATCHSQAGGGEDAGAGQQHDTGVGGQSVASHGPAPDPTLPIFQLTCKPGFRVGTDGSPVTTNDPGLALITGRCQDIGAFTVPPIRGLAARAPYFHDGSAATILDIVNFYNQRFSMGLTDQQKQDLGNYLSAL